MNYIVYKTTNLINGKIYVGVHRTNPDIFDGYIGCGVTGEIKKSKNKGFRNAVRKYGYENFRRETLFIFPDTREGEIAAYLKEAEIVTIDFVRRTDTYNLCVGGGGGTIGQINLKKVAQYTLEGKFIRVWDSATDAEQTLGLTAIHGCASNASKYCGDFLWKWFNGDTSDIPSVTKKEKPVYQFDLSGNLIKVWKSTAEAAALFSNYNSARTAICAVCHNKSAESYGYYWSYKCKFEPKKNNHLAAVAKYNDNGEFLESYSSIVEAAQANNINTPANIINTIKGYLKRCGGFRWRYFYGNTCNIKPL